MRLAFVTPTACRMAGSLGTATPMGLDDGDLDVAARFRIRIDPPGLRMIVEPSSFGRSTWMGTATAVKIFELTPR